ncbi:MAG: histidine kinase, partial [Verrucomicrobiota bacterium]
FRRRARHAVDPGQNPVTIRFGDELTGVTEIRWVATELWQRRQSGLLALAEIEAIRKDGENEAPNALVAAHSSIERPPLWQIAALTDRQASEGKLLATGEWLRGLEEARKIRERKAELLLLRELIMSRARWVAALLISAAFVFSLSLIGFLWLRDRRRLKEDSEEFRKRLAADLHDDLGGNLGSIVLLADQASEGGVDESRGDLNRVVELARESRMKLKSILRRASPDAIGIPNAEVFEERLDLLQRDFFSDVGVDLEVSGAAKKLIDSLTDRNRSEALLFCKELYHNLRQHGSVRHVMTRLLEKNGQLAIEVEDDGKPSADEKGESLSRSLRRRVRHLRGDMQVRNQEGRGNVTELMLKV